MSRTRAEALALVNWNGLFYQRFLLDRHVTALEGANGAGKTTVMIAAYVVLLPDMSRLRFTNLGETGASGGDKGIWGRLGEPGRPSYAVLDLRVADRRRLVAGVHLEKKGEPSVEPTPFIVTDLDDDVRLQDLLLVARGDRESVPELPELREGAARLGGRLKVFGSARDYFAALFEQGVTPLRLGTDEEKNKLNEMLRTSMTGGISRALTSELRDFLLKEESGLADTLQRMKANLAACRRTRVELLESRRLEREVGGVLEAGQGMFTAAWLATQERASDGERRVAEALQAQRAADDAMRDAVRALAETEAELARCEPRREAAADELAAARAWYSRVKDALAAEAALRVAAEAEARARTSAERSASVRLATEAVRMTRKAELARAEDAYKRAAVGLADMRRGIDELHRRAGAYTHVVRQVTQAEVALGLDALVLAELEMLLARAREELARVDEERREATMRLDDADAHAHRHAEVITALRSLMGLVASEPHDDASKGALRAFDDARAALERHRDDRAFAERAPAIERALDEARRLATQQARALQRAAGLGVTWSRDGRGGAHAPPQEPAPERIRGLLDASEREQGARTDAARQAEAQLGDLTRDAAALDTRLQELAARAPQWREHDARARRLSAHLAITIADAATLAAGRHTLASELAALTRTETETHEEEERLLREARELVAAGGPFEPALLRLKDELGAELVAERFDDVPIAEAGALEAWLGPLGRALVVDDPRATAAALGHRAERLGDVLLVARDANLDTFDRVVTTEPGARDVVVEEALALRVSRIPERPRLGRRARETRAAELRAEAMARAAALEAVRARRRQVERLVVDGEALLAALGSWLAGDPSAELDAGQRLRRELGARADGARATARREREAADALRPRIDGLRELLGESWLLDLADQAAQASTLADELRRARAAAAEVVRAAPFAARVERDLMTLKQAPLGADERATLAARCEAARRERGRLGDGLEALAYVRDHREALAWSEVPARLASEVALAPALAAQLSEAEEARSGAESALREAEARHDDARVQAQDDEGAWRLASERHAKARDSFAAYEVAAPSDDMVREAAAAIVRCESAANAVARERDALLTQKGAREAERTGAAERARVATERVAQERGEAEPAMTRWVRLQARAAEHRLRAHTRDEDGELADVRGHPNLVQHAKARRERLRERLVNAQDGPSLIAELDILRDTSDAEFADAIVALWLAVREWLRRRLPAQVTEVDDPFEALLRFRDQLAGLDEHMARQEVDLRGDSESVARGIDVQVRKARGQVNRLNANIEGVSFGSIAGIRVRVQPVERMEEVLRALREGSAQGLLFQEDMPFEEALDEIFRRYAGGRVGGQRLLDYREYVHLQVEIRRRTSASWEIANPTRLSTGEAIGVGAALMMVVLTEWERDATLLRGKRSHGSLRFLFLDEANRLSHDNLGVLFELCQTLDLQLLIAAPEVARAGGNTTYRLVRVSDAAGREEVEVSGRFVRSPER